MNQTVLRLPGRNEEVSVAAGARGDDPLEIAHVIYWPVAACTIRVQCLVQGTGFVELWVETGWPDRKTGWPDRKEVDHPTLLPLTLAVDLPAAAPAPVHIVLVAQAAQRSIGQLDMKIRYLQIESVDLPQG